MNAAGYHEDSDLFLHWLAKCELREDGGLHSNYGWYDGVHTILQIHY